MKSHFTIIYEPAEEGGWVASIPEIPGALSQGSTKEEAKENVLDALAELLSARRELAMQRLTPDSSSEPLVFAD